MNGEKCLFLRLRTFFSFSGLWDGENGMEALEELGPISQFST